MKLALLKNIKLTLLLGLIFIPVGAYAGSTGDLILTGFIFGIIIVPYYFFALIPYFIQKKNNGKSNILSAITYILCVGGVVLANYHILRFRLPGFCFEGICIVFYLMALPFLVIIILAARKDLKRQHYKT